MNFSQPYCYDFDRTGEYFRLAATHKRWRDSSAGWDARARKRYSSLAGGCYAARLTVLEHLVGLGRQAGVLACERSRRATDSAGGVWVVREVARATMRATPQRFGSLAEALVEMEKRIKTPEGHGARRPGCFFCSDITIELLSPHTRILFTLPIH